MVGLEAVAGYEWWVCMTFLAEVRFAICLQIRGGRYGGGRSGRGEDAV